MADNAAPARQPSHGGVAWLEWDEESFRRAQALDRPVLLDISAVWCHWCHVMDQTSYSDPDVIEIIERYYVPIRVDNDRRPDINERYNMGGWPTTAILTPHGDLLTGGTYIPPEQMRVTLARVADYYRRNKQELAARLAAQPAQRPQPAAADASALSAATVDRVLSAVRDSFDPAYGGFGDAPKFPHADAVDLALRDYQRHASQASLNVATLTLDRMAGGGVYDPVEGGFFRYATTRDWRIPHFEKMLEGNAGLLGNYLRALQVTGETRYAAIARDLMRYIDTVLSDRAQGGFYGSQDADERYYALPLAERRRRAAPYVDQTLYTDWNAMMTSAYLLAAAVLDDDRPRRFALRSLDRLWRLARTDGGAMCHYYDGDAHLPGLLSDQVHMGVALIDAYAHSADSRYLAQAQELAAFCLAELADPAGGFRDTMARPGAAGSLASPIVPLPANSAAARFLLRLYWLTGEERYQTATQRTLARFGAAYERLGYFAAPYALAVDELVQPPLKFVIVGDVTDTQLHALQRAALRHTDLWTIVQVIDPQRDAAILARSGFPPSQQPVAYPCAGTTCLAPTSDPAAISSYIRPKEHN